MYIRGKHVFISSRFHIRQCNWILCIYGQNVYVHALDDGRTLTQTHWQPKYILAHRICDQQTKKYEEFNGY